jgi:Ala-tRNA(Pro) deacylase
MELERVLQAEGIAYEKTSHTTAFTAQEVAAEEHVSGDSVAKPVIVRADDRYVLCVLPASHKIDMGQLASVLEAERCDLATEPEIARLFPDVEVGAEPPMGNLYNLPTVVDSRLAERETITFAAGTHREAIRMRYEDYERLARPTVADFATHL